MGWNWRQTLAALALIRPPGTFSQREKAGVSLPLPKGEGWGEGPPPMADWWLIQYLNEEFPQPAHLRRTFALRAPFSQGEKAHARLPLPQGEGRGEGLFTLR